MATERFIVVLKQDAGKALDEVKGLAVAKGAQIVHEYREVLTGFAATLPPAALGMNGP